MGADSIYLSYEERYIQTLSFPLLRPFPPPPEREIFIQKKKTFPIQGSRQYHLAQDNKGGDLINSICIWNYAVFESNYDPVLLACDMILNE